MKPTKDLDKAIERLQRAADEGGLIAYGTFSYGGSIASDLQAVLMALRARSRDERSERG